MTGKEALIKRALLSEKEEKMNCCFIDRLKCRPLPPLLFLFCGVFLSLKQNFFMQKISHTFIQMRVPICEWRHYFYGMCQCSLQAYFYPLRVILPNICLKNYTSNSIQLTVIKTSYASANGEGQKEQCGKCEGILPFTKM